MAARIQKNEIFNEVLQEIKHNLFNVMLDLWFKWTKIGVQHDIKVIYIKKFVEIEKDLFENVISKSSSKVKILQEQVDKLKDDAEELSKCLSVDISLMHYKEQLPLNEYKKILEQQIAGYREQAEQRRRKMEHLFKWQYDLTEKLGVTIQEVQEVPLPSEKELEQLKRHLEVLQAEKDKRAEIFFNAQVEIKDIMEKLQIKPQNKYQQTVVSSLSVDFKVTDLNMDRLAKLLQELQKKYDQTNNRVLKLRERLSKLWDCLEEDQIYQENFLQAHPGCHPHTENAIKEEIKRCDQIKRENIQLYVANVRTKIKLMWDKVMFSSNKREAFVSYYQDIFTEDTLALHELYLESITKFYNDHKQIFELVATRKNLWQKMCELEASASEPGRYRNRGGQLLREERERKAIANNLPKIESQLHDLVVEYEAHAGRNFTVDGIPLLQLINDQWKAIKLERQKKLATRKKAPTTSLLRSLATSPHGKRNRTSAANKNRPSKRQLITRNAIKAVATTSNNPPALKRSLMSTVKRRINARLTTKVAANAKSKVTGEVKKTLKVNGSILKYKTPQVKRRTGGRSVKSPRSAASQEDDADDAVPKTEESHICTYSDFKDSINKRVTDRTTSVFTRGQEVNVLLPIAELQKKRPREKTPPLLTPKKGMGNIQRINVSVTPKPAKNNLYTNSRLTRSATKLNNPATPHTPISVNSADLQRPADFLRRLF